MPCSCAPASPSSTAAAAAYPRLLPVPHVCAAPAARQCITCGMDVLQESEQSSGSGGGQPSEPGGLTAAISRAVVGTLSAALRAREAGANAVDSFSLRLDLGRSAVVPDPTSCQNPKVWMELLTCCLSSHKNKHPAPMQEHLDTCCRHHVVKHIWA